MRSYKSQINCMDERSAGDLIGHRRTQEKENGFGLDERNGTHGAGSSRHPRTLGDPAPPGRNCDTRRAADGELVFPLPRLGRGDPIGVGLE